MSSVHPLDLSNNINFMGPPSEFEKNAVEQVMTCKSYPDRYQIEAKRSFAKTFKVPEDSIAISVGSTELFSVTPFLSQHNAVILSPSFWEYQFFYEKTHGAKNTFQFILNSKDNFALNYNCLSEKIRSSAADICYLANPNNPTTTTLDKSVILKLVAEHIKVLFVVDETYLPFCSDYKCQTLMHDAVKSSNLLVVGSMSKVYALPGLRIGYGVSSKSIISNLYKHLLPYGVPTSSLKLIPVLLGQDNYMKETQKLYEQARLNLLQRLQVWEKQVKVFSEKAPFILLEFQSGQGDLFCETMKDYGITVRSGNEFLNLGSQYCRVALMSITDCNVFINAFKNVFTGN